MKCPACYNELTQKQVGSVSVDVCEGGCGGIWFDAFELQRVDDEEEQAGDHLLEIDRDARINVDPTRKRHCPRCPDIKLQRHFFSAKRKVEVDQCPNCSGYWLDAGELANIRAEKKETTETHHAARSQLSSETIRYLYRLRTEGQEK
jgi:Zn-finger nucleic acid-binding protein